MKLLEVFYYHYFLFYKNILKDTEPHLLATLVLSFSEAMFVNYGVNVIGAHVYCKYLILGKWGMLLVVIVFNGLNYLLFHSNGRAERIVRNKPMLFDNESLSKYLTIFFFLFTASLLFWVADYGMYVVENCK